MRRLPDRGLQIALGLLVLVTSFFATALPGVSTARYDQAASTALDGATLSVEGIGIPTPYLSSDAELANAGGIMRGLAQEPLLGPPTHEVGSFHSPPERSPQYRLHWSPATGGRVRYVVGRAPRTEADQPGRAVQEAGMAVAAARKHGLEPGDMIDIRSDGSNPHIRISGLYEPIDRKDPYWTEQGELLDAYPLPIPNGEALAAALVLDSAGYTSIVEDTDLLLWFRWRFPVDSEGASADQVVSAGAALKDMSTGLGSFGLGGIDLRLGGDLESRVSEFPGRLRVVQAVLALALSGLWAVAAGVLVLVCRLLAERMREYLAVMRARGASLVQLAALVCGMTAWTAVPGALIGFSLGLLVGQPALEPVLGALGVLVVALAAPAGFTVFAHRTVDRGERLDLASAKASSRRLVVEASVIALALAGVQTLRGRGLTTESAERGTDPFVSAVPVLLVLAVGLLVLRTYPYVLRLLAIGARRARSAVPFLAIAGASRQRVVGALPLLLLAMATSVAGFATAVDASLRTAQQNAAWHQVGADARITLESATPELLEKVRRVPGVTEVAPVRTLTGSLKGVRGYEAHVIAVDLDAYRRVTAGGPVKPLEIAQGTQAVTSGLPLGNILLGETELPARIEPRIAGIFGNPPEMPVALVPYKAAQNLPGHGELIYVKAPDVSAADLQRASGGTVITRADVYRKLTDDPMVRLVNDGYLAAGVAVGAYALLTVLLALLAGAEARGRTVAYLRTLGLSARQVRQLVLVELAPVIALAIGTGLAVSRILPRVLGGSIDLSPFAGGRPVENVTVDAASTLTLLGGLLAVAAVAFAIDAFVATRRGLTTALRVGD